MAAKKKAAAPEPEETVTAVDSGREPDRVVMLSIRADGTPDQHDPVIIGDQE